MDNMEGFRAIVKTDVETDIETPAGTALRPPRSTGTPSVVPDLRCGSIRPARMLPGARKLESPPSRHACGSDDDRRKYKLIFRKINRVPMMNAMSQRQLAIGKHRASSHCYAARAFRQRRCRRALPRSPGAAGFTTFMEAGFRK